MSQLTFTEADVKEAAKWLTFVFGKAKWGDNLSSKEAQEIGRFFNWCHAHVKMMQDNIFEIKKVEQGEKEPEKKSKK